MVDKNDIESAFLRAYEDYADALFRYCFFRVRDRELTKDLVQETYTRTWRTLASGVKVENLRAFLYKVALNLIIDHSRRKKTLSLDELEESGFEPSFDSHEHLQDFLDGARALERLAEMDEKYREVIHLRFVVDLAPREIAIIIGESENVVSVRLHRGLKKLKHLLGEEDEK